MEEKKKDKEKKGRERNGYASEEVEIMRAVGRWMSADLSKRDKDTDKQKRRERIKESMYNRDRKFRSTWGERVQEREK
ncbi:hypothetical protein MTP99_004531 [Tenebrio molitor]|jgi:hypothetical protein|nr:hypothetical protein MTP99_004531 [Tenebrio molitor]